MTGANGVLHLAAIADEAAMTALLDVNIAGTHHVLEAARQNGVRRVVLASTNHVTGMYPAGQPISVSSPVRPDSFYGVSKVAMEALGRLYADKFGLEVACIRIGSCLPRPTEPRHRHTWLSHRDTVAAFEAAMTANDLGFATFYAASANRASWWLSDAPPTVAYRPLDNADDHIGRLPEYSGPQGGHFASADYTLAKQEESHEADDGTRRPFPDLG
jgi:uronate dehydrogenase